jgi:hypothetical protein
MKKPGLEGMEPVQQVHEGLLFVMVQGFGQGWAAQPFLCEAVLCPSRKEAVSVVGTCLG